MEKGSGLQPFLFQRSKENQRCNFDGVTPFKSFFGKHATAVQGAGPDFNPAGLVNPITGKKSIHFFNLYGLRRTDLALIQMSGFVLSLGLLGRSTVAGLVVEGRVVSFFAG